MMRLWEQRQENMFLIGQNNLFDCCLTNRFTLDLLIKALLLKINYKMLKIWAFESNDLFHCCFINNKNLFDCCLIKIKRKENE